MSSRVKSVLKVVVYNPRTNSRQMTLDNGSHQISLLLIDWSKGDESALEQLMPLVDHELRLMARRHIGGQPSGHTFQTTGLIHFLSTPA